MKKEPNSNAIVVAPVGEEMPPVEILAEEIKSISDGIRKLLSGPLNEKALILLIQNAAPNVKARYGTKPISAECIRSVLEGIESLERTYLKAK